jgi:hypothetical protein
LANEVEAKTQTLTQTETDLANAILLIQEKELELAKFKQPTSIEIPLTVDDADNATTAPVSTNASFGIKFPENPQRGDLYIRVDMLPNKLFKWNGTKWIEVDKTTNDRYVYEEEYIRYVAEQVRSGQIDFNDLTKAEQEEVLKRLDYHTKSNL